MLKDVPDNVIETLLAGHSRTGDFKIQKNIIMAENTIRICFIEA